MRQRLAEVYIEHTVLDLIRMRTLTARLKGEQPGPEASIRKILGRRARPARDGAGHATCSAPSGDADRRRRERRVRARAPTRRVSARRSRRRAAYDPGWYDGFMFSQALTIGGGTGEVQRNIVAERVLGLPHDVDVQQGLSWREAQQVGGAG